MGSLFPQGISEKNTLKTLRETNFSCKIEPECVNLTDMNQISDRNLLTMQTNCRYSQHINLKRKDDYETKFLALFQIAIIRFYP